MLDIVRDDDLDSYTDRKIFLSRIIPLLDTGATVVLSVIPCIDGCLPVAGSEQRKRLRWFRDKLKHYDNVSIALHGIFHEVNYSYEFVDQVDYDIYDKVCRLMKEIFEDKFSLIFVPPHDQISSFNEKLIFYKIILFKK